MNPYQRAVDAELVSTHLGIADSSDSDEEAKRKLDELIRWHVDVATDPAVNGGFVLALVEKEPVTKLTLEDGKTLSFEEQYWGGPKSWQMFSQHGTFVRTLDKYEVGFIHAALSARK